jgi:hypothetical protein
MGAAEIVARATNGENAVRISIPGLTAPLLSLQLLQ